MPKPSSAFPPPCRLGDLPPHPPCALYRLHPAVQRAALRGTCPAPTSPSGGNGAWLSPGEGWGPADVGLLPLLSTSLFPLLSPRVSASLQDRMVLLVMGNIINWSL